MVFPFDWLRDRQTRAQAVHEEAGFAVERWGDQARTRVDAQLRAANLPAERRTFLNAVRHELPKSPGGGVRR
jgi:hypothetical protein